MLRLTDYVEYLVFVTSTEFLVVEAVGMLISRVDEELMNDIRIAFIAPVGEIGEGHGQHVVRVLLVVL